MSDGTANLWKDPHGPGPLAGVRVVDFGQYIAGPMAAMLLADQGADVIRIDPPGGPRWDSPANAALLRGRRSVTLDLKTPADRDRAAALIRSADVVIENFRPGVMDRLGLGAEHFRDSAPQLIYCSMPGFGADDERADMPAWEGVVMAAGAAYSLSGLRIPGGAAPDSPPAFSPLPLGSVFAALSMALAVAAALIARDRDGHGQRIEVPLFDSLFDASGAQALTLERSPLRGTSFGSGFFRCADGRYLTFVAQWFRHLEWFVKAAGKQSWIDEGLVNLDRLRRDPDAQEELQQRLTALFATRDARDWEDLGRAHGCSLAMVRTTQEFRNEPAALESGALADVFDPVFGEVRVPGSAVALSAHPDVVGVRPLVSADTPDIVTALDSRSPTAAEAPSAPSNRDLPLAGIRVLDLSRVVAAPMTGRLLAQLGADVVKLDVDPSGSTAAFEEPLFHVHLNRGKKTIIADLTTSDGQEVLSELLKSTDVVVQNFTLGTAERLGTDLASLRAHSPEIINVYLNAFGTSGEWASFRGYAELANVSSGLSEFTLGDTPPPSGSSPSLDFPRWIFTDYATGIVGAFGSLLALRDRRRAGEGQQVETSLLRITALEQILWILSESDAAADRSRGRAATGWSPLQRLYDTADGTLFLGATPEQTAHVLDALDVSPVPAGELERTLEEAFAQTDTATICAALRAVGVGAHHVTSLPELMPPGGIADQRGLRLSDESPRHGTVVMPGPVIRLSDTPMVPGNFPAPFGADGDKVLAAARDQGTRRTAQTRSVPGQ